MSECSCPPQYGIIQRFLPVWQTHPWLPTSAYPNPSLPCCPPLTSLLPTLLCCPPTPPTLPCYPPIYPFLIHPFVSWPSSHCHAACPPTLPLASPPVHPTSSLFCSSLGHFTHPSFHHGLCTGRHPSSPALYHNLLCLCPLWLCSTISLCRGPWHFSLTCSHSGSGPPVERREKLQCTLFCIPPRWCLAVDFMAFSPFRERERGGGGSHRVVCVYIWTRAIAILFWMISLWFLSFPTGFYFFFLKTWELPQNLQENCLYIFPVQIFKYLNIWTRWELDILIYFPGEMQINVKTQGLGRFGFLLLCTQEHTSLSAIWYNLQLEPKNTLLSRPLRHDF